MSFCEDVALFFMDGDAAMIAGQTVMGHYAAPYSVALQGGPGVAGALAQYSLPTESVPAAWEGAHLDILEGLGAGAYTVRNHQPDGSGVSVLDLEIAA